MATHDIVIHGAGSVGCYVGGLLAVAGAAVAFLGRERLQEEIAAHGMVLTDWRGHRRVIRARDVRYATDPSVLAEADMVLVTVKSAATSTAAEELARYARPDALIVSLQNGIRNAQALRDRLPATTVLPGMVPFNVVRVRPGHWHRGTDGELHMAADERLASWLPLFAAAELPVVQHTDMLSVLWGKLLLNLNNPINALSGMPLREELSARAFRRCLALSIAEALRVLAAANLRPVQVGRVPPAWLPRVLDTPDWLFRRIAASMLKIDAAARSSMWEDFEQGRATEIDYLNGEVIQLAASLGLQAPVNAKAWDLVKRAERGGRRNWSGPALLQQFETAGRPA